MFCDVTVTSDDVHASIQVNVCANFEEIPSTCSWDIVFYDLPVADHHAVEAGKSQCLTFEKLLKPPVFILSQLSL